jgi:hypothetical protein
VRLSQIKRLEGTLHIAAQQLGLGRLAAAWHDEAGYATPFAERGPVRPRC